MLHQGPQYMCRRRNFMTKQDGKDLGTFKCGSCSYSPTLQQISRSYCSATNKWKIFDPSHECPTKLRSLSFLAGHSTSHLQELVCLWTSCNRWVSKVLMEHAKGAPKIVRGGTENVFSAPRHRFLPTTCYSTISRVYYFRTRERTLAERRITSLWCLASRNASETGHDRIKTPSCRNPPHLRTNVRRGFVS